jgi:hypothetical protein
MHTRHTHPATAPHRTAHPLRTQSCVDVTFWSELSDRKLDEYKLSEEPIEVQGAAGSMCAGARGGRVARTPRHAALARTNRPRLLLRLLLHQAS